MEDHTRSLEPFESVDGLPRVCGLYRRVIKRKGRRNRLSSQLKKDCQGFCRRPHGQQNHGPWTEEVPPDLSLVSPSRPQVSTGMPLTAEREVMAAELVSA
jgi:hypothetical protein